jgi:hypothetical protein
MPPLGCGCVVSKPTRLNWRRKWPNKWRHGGGRRRSALPSGNRDSPCQRQLRLRLHPQITMRLLHTQTFTTATARCKRSSVNWWKSCASIATARQQQRQQPVVRTQQLVAAAVLI